MRLASLHSYPVKGAHRTDHDGAWVHPRGLAGDRCWMVVDPDGRMISQSEEPGLARVRPSAVDGGLCLRAAGAADLWVPDPAGGTAVQVSLYRLPVQAVPAGPAADHWLTAVLDRPVRLVRLPEPDQPDQPETDDPADPAITGSGARAANGNRLLLTNTASLDALSDWLLEAGSPEGPVPMTRFRPNVVIGGTGAWVEDGWPGRRLRIGSVTFRAVKPCNRCVVTTVDQETGERGHEPLRILARYRKVGQQLLFGTYLVPDGTGPLAVGDPVTVLDA